jgi:hypothetical protein
MIETVIVVKNKCFKRFALYTSQEVRWNTNLNMLRSFSGQLAKVSSFLVKNGKADLLLPDRVDEDFLERLISFFEAFERAVKLVEGDEKPTLQNVLPAYERLLRHCKDNLDDSLVGTLAAKFFELLPVST